MDISDSLYITIKEMARLSNKKFVIDNLSSVNPSLSNNLNYNKYINYFDKNFFNDLNYLP